jgi:tryptophan synthase beta chain
MNSTLSALLAQGYIEARTVQQTEVFEAATLFARTEGTLPAPESAHAIKAAIDEALLCKKQGRSSNIVFGLTGTGYFDMYAYARHNDGKMDCYIPSDAEIEAALSKLPEVKS